MNLRKFVPQIKVDRLMRREVEARRLNSFVKWTGVFVKFAGQEGRGRCLCYWPINLKVPAKAVIVG